MEPGSSAGAGGQSAAGPVSTAANGGGSGTGSMSAAGTGQSGADGGQSGVNEGQSGANGSQSGANGGQSGTGGAASAPRCGNGVREADELCDGPDCPATCEPSTGCLKVSLEGSNASCDARCSVVETTECTSGDDCCAGGCKYPEDSDCSKSCGDGVVDSPELCEPESKDKPCPSSCDDAEPCTRDIKTGTPEQCNVVCSHMPVTAAKSGDQCCPRNANANTDDDCSPKCGNAIKEGSEVCDGNCPSSCDDGDPCTSDKLNGAAAQCTAACTHAAVARAANGDGCCPPGANSSNDDDCSPSCGNGVKEGSELCDGNCPSSCVDNDPCTADKLSGSPSQCNVVCSHSPITRTGPEACNDNNPCTKDLLEASTTSCTRECVYGPAATRSPPTTTCDDRNPCTKDSLVDSKDACTSVCMSGPATARSGPTESDCNDSDPCTEDVLVKSETSCTTSCMRKTMSNGSRCNGTRTCSDGVCLFCGDQKITGDEECDPNAAGWNAVSCGSDCKRRVYRRCSGNSDCNSNEMCHWGVCSAHCSSRDDTVCDTIPNTTSKCVGAGTSSACAIVCTNTPCPIGFSQKCNAVAADIEAENTFTICTGDGV
jgi:hypothetical protein